VARAASWRSTRAAPVEQAGERPSGCRRAPVGTRFAWIPQHNLFAVSPDGRRLAFVAPRAMAGFFSCGCGRSPPVGRCSRHGRRRGSFLVADSRFIAFFSDGKVKKINSSGGPPVTLCEARGDYPSGSWGSQHSILFAAATQQFISLVADGGALPRRLKDGCPRQERAVRLRASFPTAATFLYTGASPTEKRPLSAWRASRRQDRR
jgi:hypothetical protein